MTLQEEYEKETGREMWCLSCGKYTVSEDYILWLENDNKKMKQQIKSMQESIDKMQKALGGVV